MNNLIQLNHYSLHLRILAVLLAAIPAAYKSSGQAPDDVITLKGNVSLHVVDRTGKQSVASAVPEDLRNRLEGIDLGKAGSESSGLVVAKVKLPRGEEDVYYGSSLVGKGWYGGIHYLNVGNGANPDVVCIRLGRRDGECRFELKKLNYKPIVIPLPAIDPRGKIIWLGELSPERYNTSEVAQKVVSGKVVSTSGKPIGDGKVTIRVNGTPAKVSVPIKDGAFAFANIGPGDYLIEFWMDGYSAETWWLSLKDGNPQATKTITAYPRRNFSLRIHDGAKTEDISLVAGIPYRDAKFPLPDRKEVRLNQEGDAISLYCPQYFIRVVSKTRGNPYYSWRGDFGKGDVIEIVNPKSNAIAYTVDCLATTSAGAPQAGGSPLTQQSVPTQASARITESGTFVPESKTIGIAATKQVGSAPEESSRAASLPWEKDYASALARAKAEKRPIFLMLTATWCGPCKMLEGQTLPDPLTLAALKEFVWVKAYEDKELNARFGCSGYPTLVFIDADKERALGRTVGYQTPKPFLKPIIEARKVAGLTLTPEMQKAVAASFEPDRRKIEELSWAGDLEGLIAYLQPVARDELRKNNYLVLRVHLPSGLAPSDVVCLASGKDIILSKAGLSAVSTSRTAREAEVRIVAPGYRAIQERVPSGDSAPVQSREYQLEPLLPRDAASFSGRALLPTGAPAAESIVRICDWGAVVRTDKDGRFRINNISPGKFLVRAERPGGEFHSELEFSPGAELKQDLRMQAATTIGLRWARQTEEGVLTFTGKGVRTGEAYFSVGHSRFLLERGAQTREYWGSDLMLKDWNESLRQYAKPEALAALDKAPPGTPIFWLFDGTSRRTGLHRESARFEDIAAVNDGNSFDEQSYFEFLRGQPVTAGTVYTLRCVRRDCYAKLEVTDVTIAAAKP